MSIFSNMAPDTMDLLDKLNPPPFEFKHALVSCMRMEIYFKAKNIRSDKEKIYLVLFNSDFEMKKFLLERKEEYLSGTWRQFKLRLKKYKQSMALEKLLKNKQDDKVRTKDWLEKAILIAEDADLNQDYAKMLIYNTAFNYRNSLMLDKSQFMKEDIYKNKEKICYEVGIFEEQLKIYEKNEERKLKNYVNQNKSEPIKPIGDIKTNINVKKKEIREVEVNQIEIKKLKNELQEEIKINGEKLNAIIDLGSEINLISENKTKERGLIIENCEKIILKNVFGKIKEVNKMVKITLDMRGRIVTEDFYVTSFAEEDVEVLIGYNTVNKLNRDIQEIENLINKFPKLFDEERTEGYEDIICEIETKPGRKVNIKSRKIAQEYIKGATKTINKLLEMGYIEPSTSSWCNPMKPVPKGKDDVRITSNMQFLNSIVEDNNYTIPRIQEIIEKTQGMQYFTVLDLKDGYFQIKINPEHKFKTAFYFRNRLYQYTRMPQGFKNSPAIFQAIMDRVLYRYLDIECCVYLDDIIIFGRTEEEHDRHLDNILQTLMDAKFKINVEKMQYKQKKVKILGMLVDGVKKYPIDEKIKKTLEFKTPTNKKELQSFLGFVNYYRNYIKNIATISAPLYEASKTKNEEIMWNDECEEAFNKLKEKLSSEVSNYIPDIEKPFILTTDASNTGIGACLQQEDKGELRVIDWASKKLTPAEKKYGITEKEFLAMAWAIEHYEYYLRGRKFTVITDHIALLSSRNKHIFGNLRLERMRERLQEYDFDIKYKKGEELVDADTMSRIYEEPEPRENLRDKNKNVMIGNDNKWYYRISEKEIRVFPEIKEREEILRKAHEETTAHGGQQALEYEIKKEYYWPKLADSIKRFIKNCEACVINDQKTAGGENFVATERPLEIMAMDLMFVDQKNVLLTCIDYYTRLVRVFEIESKEPKSILNGMGKIFNEIGFPRMLITDNGKEFTAGEVKRYLCENNVEHHTISVEKHQANGRVERLHRTIWQALRKYTVGEITNLEKLIESIVEKINNTYHRGIKCTPNEAWNEPENKTVKEMNSNESEYNKEFKRCFREKFNEGDEVFIQTTSLKAQNKLNDKFDERGIVLRSLENDSYLIKSRDKTFKKSHSQLKRVPL